MNLRLPYFDCFLSIQKIHLYESITFATTSLFTKLSASVFIITEKTNSKTQYSRVDLYLKFYFRIGLYYIRKKFLSTQMTFLYSNNFLYEFYIKKKHIKLMFMPNIEISHGKFCCTLSHKSIIMSIICYTLIQMIVVKCRKIIFL